MDVKAIHQIIRRGENGKQEIIKPGQVFSTSGEELADLKAAKAISTNKDDVKEAKVRSRVDAEDLDDDDGAHSADQGGADDAGDGQQATAKAPATAKAATAKAAAPKTKAAAPAKSAAVAAAEKKAAEKKTAEDEAANQAAADAAGTDEGNAADTDENDLL